jgi:hypothetical protein
LLCNAIPSEERWRVRVCAGYVQSAPTAPQGGHAYVTYCRESDGEWVILDWCYYEDSAIPVHKKPMAKDKVRYQDIWFSFNHEYSWAHSTLEISGRVKEKQNGR